MTRDPTSPGFQLCHDQTQLKFLWQETSPPPPDSNFVMTKLNLSFCDKRPPPPDSNFVMTKLNLSFCDKRPPLSLSLSCFSATLSFLHTFSAQVSTQKPLHFRPFASQIVSSRRLIKCSQANTNISDDTVPLSKLRLPHTTLILYYASIVSFFELFGVDSAVEWFSPWRTDTLIAQNMNLHSGVATPIYFRLCRFFFWSYLLRW